MVVYLETAMAQASFLIYENNQGFRRLDWRAEFCGHMLNGRLSDDV